MVVNTKKWRSFRHPDSPTVIIQNFLGPGQFYFQNCPARPILNPTKAFIIEHTLNVIDSRVPLAEKSSNRKKILIAMFRQWS